MTHAVTHPATARRSGPATDHARAAAAAPGPVPGWCSGRWPARCRSGSSPSPSPPSASLVQLGWIPPAEERTGALGALVLTGLGVLSGAWAAACLTTLGSPPGTASDGLGVLLLTAGARLLLPAVAAHTEAVSALVILTSAVRFAVTGIAGLDGGRTWTAGPVSHRPCSAVARPSPRSWRAASRAPSCPPGRTGAGRRALDGRLPDQVDRLATEAGVRQQL